MGVDVVLHRDVFWLGKQWAVTGYGVQAVDKKLNMKFDIEAGDVVVGAVPQDGRTLVRGSTSRLHHELSQFLTTLAHAEEVRQNTAGPGASGAG